MFGEVGRSYPYAERFCARHASSKIQTTLGFAALGRSFAGVAGVGATLSVFVAGDAGAGVGEGPHAMHVSESAMALSIVDILFKTTLPYDGISSS